jgi:hypothetical protein
VDLSTIHPDTVSAQAERLQSLGAEYLGSPSKHRDTPLCLIARICRYSSNIILVFGGVPLAKARQVTLVLAGSSEVQTIYNGSVSLRSRAKGPFLS